MRCVYFFPLLILVSGCSQLPEKISKVDTASWRSHQERIKAISAWDIKGRLAIQHENANGTISIRWKQSHTSYQLRFTTLLGQKTYTLESTGNSVIMQGTDIKTLTAKTPEQLMLQTLGWTISLEALKYWLRGIPKPDTEYSQLILDEKGRLSAMKQADFNIKISRYIEKNGISLPKKIYINNNDLLLKLVIQNWNL